jgi:hypothetical protein
MHRFIKKLLKPKNDQQQVQPQVEDFGSNQAIIDLMNSVPNVEEPTTLLEPEYLPPTELDLEAMQARIDGTLTPGLEDREYEETVSKAQLLFSLKMRVQGELGDAKFELSEYEKSGQVDPEELQRKQAKVKKCEVQRERVVKTRDLLYSRSRDQRNNWIDRRIQGENRGAKKISPLGRGNMGQVWKVGRRDGVERAFKPESPVAEHGSVSGIDADHGMNSSREVASAEVAKLLKSGVLGQIDFGEVNGQLGTLSDIAVGDPLFKLRDVKELNYTEEELALARELELTQTSGGVESIYEGSDFDFTDPGLQRELMELQINDILSGQVDRHSGNFRLERDEEGGVTSLHAFDNDMSFGSKLTTWLPKLHRPLTHTVGLPPLLSEDQAKRIEDIEPDELYGKVRRLLPEEEAKAALKRLNELQDHVKELRLDKMIFKTYDQSTYDQLREFGRDRSYLARHAQTMEDRDFARWQFDNR